MIKHLAMMMDGNRRWAKKNSLQPWLGHRKGVESVKTAIEYCLTRNIQYLSIYTFSLENFKRSEQEKKYVFDLIAHELAGQLDTFLERGIRIRFVGDRSLFPAQVIDTCKHIEETTAHLTALVVNALFCYGAQQEIVEGVKEVVRKIKAGELQETDLNTQTFQEHMWLGNIPAPDLVIRTGGARRLSNFMLYQSAYSEFCFLDCLWPELSTEHLENACEDFYTRKRNFGA